MTMVPAFHTDTIRDSCTTIKPSVRMATRSSATEQQTGTAGRHLCGWCTSTDRSTIDGHEKKLSRKEKIGDNPCLEWFFGTSASNRVNLFLLEVEVRN